MQPTYLPWSGYFNLINSVDYFVFLNDVQFSKRSWQQRNRISLNGNEQYLTIPVLNKGKRSQLINEVELCADSIFYNKHLTMIKMAYNKCEHGNDVIKLYENSGIEDYSSLQDINIILIKKICEEIGITTPLLYSSDIPVNGTKSDYLLKICQYLGVTEYLSPVGSKQYIEEEKLFKESDIRVEYQDFTPKEYDQCNSNEFISSLSIIDVIANIGFKETKEYIKQGGGKTWT